MADLVRIFAADKGTKIGDTSHDSANPPDVIIEVEASAAECAQGAQYRVGGFARDYATGAVGALVAPIGTVPAGNVCNAGQWPVRNHEFVFNLPANVIAAAAANGIVELVAFVSVGLAAVGASADIEDTMFMWVV